MKGPTFMEGAGVAFALSVSAAALFSVLLLFVTGGLALRAVVSGIGFAYVAYLLARSGERVGRVSAVAGWLLLSGATWVMAPPLPLFLALHIGGVWLIRSLYYHAGVLSALVDAALGVLGFAAALWAGIQSNSLFLSVWCFFLVQALFVVIPVDWRRSRSTPRSIPSHDDSFEHAHRAAEAAVRRLSTIR